MNLHLKILLLHFLVQNHCIQKRGNSSLLCIPQENKTSAVARNSHQKAVMLLPNLVIHGTKVVSRMLEHEAGE